MGTLLALCTSQGASFASFRPQILPTDNFLSTALGALEITVDETEARSCFGTKDYWDDVYLGRGDFPSDTYTWYYGWEVLGRVVEQYIPDKGARILVPGIGNDDILLDLHKAGYMNMVGQDYSEHAVERQIDLLSYEGISIAPTEDAEKSEEGSIQVMQGDVTNLPESWTESFDIILEKGLLDAVYLSGDGNMEAASDNLSRVLRTGGIFISVSGVVPHELRLEAFNKNGWKWLKDGSDDLKAGCFVWQKRWSGSVLWNFLQFVLQQSPETA